LTTNFDDYVVRQLIVSSLPHGFLRASINCLMANNCDLSYLESGTTMFILKNHWCGGTLAFVRQFR